MTTLSPRVAALAAIGVAIPVIITLAMPKTTATSNPAPDAIMSPAPVVAAAPSAREIADRAAAPGYREVVIPAGTRISVRMNGSYSSASNRIEDRVGATLVTSVRAGGVTVLPAGSRISGIVSSVARPGKVKGRGVIGVRLTQITANGDRYPVSVSYTRVAPSGKKRDIATIAAPAVGGAILGAILGGKKGALIGTAVGGGAGTAVVLTTRGKDAYIGSGSVISLTLRQPLRVRVAAP